ncbi:hypothetical protein ACHAXM_001525 [Skeletonema potamos]
MQMQQQQQRTSAVSNKKPGGAALFKTSTWILIVLCASCSSFYVGVALAGVVIISGGQFNTAKHYGADHTLNVSSNNNSNNQKKDDEEIQRRAEEMTEQKLKLLTSPHNLQELCNKHLCNFNDGSAANSQQINHGSRENKLLFPRGLNHFANGLVRVSKDDIMSTFDFGVPPNPNSKGKEALILYNTYKALPNDRSVAAAANLNGYTALPFINATTATENCDSLNVVFTDIPGGMRQCFALIGGQYQSYHIQRWMRRGDKYGGLKKDEPLRLTSRGHTGGGREEFKAPNRGHVAAHQESLKTYLNEVKGIKERLMSVLKRINSKQVVVMTCNHGQSELLMNFVCSSRAKGFDLSNVLLFPTDVETKELAEGLGLTTFYEEKLMASIPKNEADVYGDVTFTKVMFAKIVCVQLVNELGFDLLFMDVDIVWYRNPLDYFMDKSLPEFDVYFQDDGSRQERYAPYSANSGFYFVRANDRTKHLFRHLLYNGDLLNAWYSHQQVLIVLLSEYNSLLGLKVKVFAKELDLFPGGWLFHRQPKEMKKIMQGESNDLYIFHMSWTENKLNKLKFFQQIGQWYVQEACVGKHYNEIVGGDSSVPLSTHCCLAEPLVKCHYKDKPSKIPCNDSPLLDQKRGRPFW